MGQGNDIAHYTAHGLAADINSALVNRVIFQHILTHHAKERQVAGSPCGAGFKLRIAPGARRKYNDKITLFGHFIPAGTGCKFFPGTAAAVKSKDYRNILYTSAGNCLGNILKIADYPISDHCMMNHSLFFIGGKWTQSVYIAAVLASGAL